MLSLSYLGNHLWPLFLLEMEILFHNRWTAFLPYGKDQYASFHPRSWLLGYRFLRGIQPMLHYHNQVLLSSRLWKASYLPKLLHLLVKIRIQFLRHIFHPQQRPSVFCPALLHSVDGQPRIRYSSVSKGLYFLVESAQRSAQCQPVTEQKTESVRDLK